MTIGELATRAGVSTATIRYYERIGVIASAPRSRAGYRQYAPAMAEQLRFIKRTKALGFSLSEIRELLAIRIDDSSVCSQVEETAHRKVQVVDQRIRELERIRRALEGVVESCRTHRLTDPCPMLADLREH